MRAVISVVGKDNVGILADVSSTCSKKGANVLEVSQTILQDMFAMIMLVEVGSEKDVFQDLQVELDELGNKRGLKIHAMHEDIFNAMHTI